MPKKTRDEFIQDYEDRAAEFGAVVDDDEVKRMADRAERLGHIKTELKAPSPRVTESVAAVDRSGSSRMWNAEQDRLAEAQAAADDSDLMGNFVPEEPVDLEALQVDRLAASGRGWAGRNVGRAVLGAAPVPTTKEGAAQAVVLGGIAGTGLAYPAMATVGEEIEFQGDRKARAALDAADVSDIHNAHLDKEYYRAMGETGRGTKQMKAATAWLDETPAVRPSDPGDYKDYKASPEARARVDGLRDDWADASRDARMGREDYPGKHRSAHEAWKGPRDGLSAAEWDGPAVVDDALDMAFDGWAKTKAGRDKMAKLKSIGNVALKAAYVGPWGMALEATELALAVPLMALENYGEITDPVEQMDFFAREALKRPLKAGDMSPEGLAWLSSHSDGREDLYERGVLSHALYQSMQTSEGVDEARRAARVAYDAAEKWTPSREEIRSLSGGR